MANQVNVFAQNQPGRLERLTEVLLEEGINIRAITISGAEDYGVIKLLVDDPHKAFEALQREGFSAFLKEVIAVVMDDRPGGLHRICRVLGRERGERGGRLRIRLPGPQDGHPGGGGGEGHRGGGYPPRQGPRVPLRRRTVFPVMDSERPSTPWARARAAARNSWISCERGVSPGCAMCVPSPAAGGIPSSPGNIWPPSLREAGLDYVWLGDELGGYRKGGYETHMETEPFRAGFQSWSALPSRSRRRGLRGGTALEVPPPFHRQGLGGTGLGCGARDRRLPRLGPRRARYKDSPFRGTRLLK